MKKAGYAETTIEDTSKRLKRIAKHVNLDDPETVKGYIASKDCTMAYKSGLVDCYDRYVVFNGLKWSKPYYKREDPIIKLPTEERVNRIIASCRLKHALEFTLIKEGGFRPIELHRLTLKEIDLEKGIIYVKTAKHGKSRNLELKPKTLAMLKTYVSKHNKGLTDILFSTPRTMSKAWQRARNRTAEKYQDPECYKIRLYDLRHFYGSMLYHKMKDLIYVKNKMGHKSISSTMKYMHLVNFESDEYISKVTDTIEQAQKLIESGFEYVTTFEDKMIFKKRK